MFFRAAPTSSAQARTCARPLSCMVVFMQRKNGSITRAKSIPLSGHPCRTPLKIQNASPDTPSQIVSAALCAYIPLMILMKPCGALDSESTSIRKKWDTLGKAAAKSQKHRIGRSRSASSKRSVARGVRHRLAAAGGPSLVSFSSSAALEDKISLQAR